MSEEQQAANKSFASIQVPVEHGIRRIKSWRIVREDYRLELDWLPLMASTVVGLVRLVRLKEPISTPPARDS